MSDGKKGFWSRLVAGLGKTRDNIVSGIDSIFSGFSSIDEDFYEEIEEILIMERHRRECNRGDYHKLKAEGARAAYQRACGVQGAVDPQHQGADGCWRDSIPL